MKIVYVTHIAFPDVVGDPFHSLELARKMSARGHKTTVVTWNKRSPSSNRIEEVNNVSVWRLAGTSFKLNNLITEYPFIRGMTTAFGQLKPDIVHAHSHLFLTSVQAIRKAKRLGLPSVITVHGVLAHRNMVVNFAQHAYLHALGSMILRNANSVVCLTRGDVGEIVKLGCPQEKIRLIPNAVDTARFRPSKKREGNLIVWIGRFVPEKGLEHLIEAAQMTAKRAKDAKFLLIGYGPWKTKIAKLAHDYGLLPEVVRIAGPLEADEVAETLGRADVFVFPSVKEGLPISILEAMASGAAVVGSDISGIRDVITHRENGILIPPRNPQALADAILDLLDDNNLRRKMGQKARELMINEYSWDTITSRIENVYLETVGIAA